jgi:hypothetical protein
MALPLDLLRKLSRNKPKDAWKTIFNHAWEICTKPITAKNPAGEVSKRDREIAALDLFLASAGWDLWTTFEGCTEHTTDALADWWKNQDGGKAVLVLDALSLREAPWIIHGAQARGYELVTAKPMAAELPADTTPFAKALGYGERGALENNGAPSTNRLAKAHTDTVAVPWKDCAGLIAGEPRWVLWHQWPDNKVHEWSGAGKGVEMLAQEAATQLTSDDFWQLIDRLTTGRRLVITSDHGYAATGLFPDTPEDQAKQLKNMFKSSRHAAVNGAGSSCVPPLDLVVASRHGENRYVVGRRKWKSQGGYPTLAHGGLSVLEVISPFIELARKRS